MSAEDPLACIPTAQQIPVPRDRDPLRILARRLCHDQAASLPDLSHCVVLLDPPGAAQALRTRLLDDARNHGCPALLGPRITRLRDWAAGWPHDGPAPLSPHGQELTLVEALQSHRGLFTDADPWTLSSHLLTLFDELTLQRITLPAALPDFMARLERAYRSAVPLSGLSREAEVVHRLWRAWHRQLAEHKATDRQAAYLAQLEASLSALPATTQIYLCGFDTLSAAEQAWASALAARGQLSVLISPTPGGEPPRCAYSRFLDAVFPTRREPHFAARATAWAQGCPHSPANGRLLVYRAPDTEREARAIDLQVRRCLLDDKQHIAIVTEDRRLARRVRALLERSGVPLFDAAGWALSTSRAAATLERWLETVEEDFAYAPLTDVLKSPFVLPHWSRDKRLGAVYRFEQDLVHHENVGRGLARYREHLRYRARRLRGARGEAVKQLLSELEHAAAPLTSLLDRSQRHPPAHLLAALDTSLERLGMRSCFAADTAGQRILEELAALKCASRHQSLTLNWQEFRTWLGRTLERYNFRPPVSTAPVRLLNLGQSALLHCEALIIAAATTQHLPPRPPAAPFFNDRVRRELGLPDSRSHHQRAFRRFTRLLHATPSVLITCRATDGQQTQTASPWLDALDHFHRLAYGTPLSDGGLGQWVNRPEAEVVHRDSAALPTPRTRPAPTAKRIPQQLSARACQQLLDCPYQFFAAHCLELAPPDTIREALEKSDYGERVHRALQAFHQAVPGLPGPFPAATVTTARREAAIVLLQDISEAVFAEDMEDNFQHRAWHQRWRKRIPAFVDWLIRRGRTWRVEAVERNSEIQLASAVSLRGRLDRIDRSKQGLGIVDYKTGTPPTLDAVTRGEAVQLPIYALLAGESACRVEYLALDKEPPRPHAPVEGEALTELTTATRQRLVELVTAIKNGAALPAWGDSATCRHCPMAGLCRRQEWGEQATAPRQEPE